MLLREIKNIFHIELDSIYPKEEVDAFFYGMIEHFLGLERFVLAIQPELSLNKEEEQPLFEGLARLRLEEPLQYILGEAHFMDLSLNVNKHVLIPRPETEELVQWIIGAFNVRASTSGSANNDTNISEPKTHDPKPNILDIGTGSGCMAIALAKAFPQAKIFALDISKEALKVAEENARKNEVCIEFIHADILNLNLKLEHDLDIIVSNPPYVRAMEKSEIRNNVKKFEPQEALFVSDVDPLMFYRAIVKLAKTWLKPAGWLFFEINQYLAAETQQLMEDNLFNEVELRKDIFGNFRMLKGRLFMNQG